MSEADDGPNTTIPTQAIHRAYQESLQARSSYQSAAGGQFEAAAHEKLHNAVSDYFEVMRPLLENSNATRELWEEKKLWPTEPKYQAVAICKACDFFVPESESGSGAGRGDLCPECGQQILERESIPKTDENGEVVYEWREGLKSVQNIWDQRVEKQVTRSDALGDHTEVVVETKLVPVEHLKVIARELDSALKALDLHAKSDDKLPKGRLDEKGR